MLSILSFLAIFVFSVQSVTVHDSPHDHLSKRKCTKNSYEKQYAAEITKPVVTYKNQDKYSGSEKDMNMSKPAKKTESKSRDSYPSGKQNVKTANTGHVGTNALNVTKPYKYIADVGNPNAGAGKLKFLSKSETDQLQENYKWMDTCKNGVAFCCWSLGPKNSNSKQCGSQDKGHIHCHGTVIRPGCLEEAKLAMNYVQVWDHLQKRNYSQPLKGVGADGAPHKACGCAEDMPRVKRSDASMLKQGIKYKVGKTGLISSEGGNFQNVNLVVQHKKWYPNAKLENPAECPKKK